jgi:DNA end-binding protein Ku
VPQQHAEKAYRLLVEAMEKTGKVGIAKFTMRQKEYLAALRPTEGVICLETMYFADEVTRAKEVEDAPREMKVDTRELNMAEKLIDGLTTEFKPEQYHDEFRERIMELIKKKAHGEEIVVKPHKEQKQTRASDLMAALEASLAKARKKGVEASSEEEEVATQRRGDTTTRRSGERSPNGHGRVRHRKTA